MSDHLRIKICGITSLADGLAAAEAGADMLGLNFYPPSPRFLPLERCQALCADLRRRLGNAITLVGVFVNPSAVQLTEALGTCGLDLLQLCGTEAPELLQAFPGQGKVGRAFKAIRPADAADLQNLLAAYPAPAAAPAWLVDAYHPQVYGGSGQTGDWSLAAGLARQAPILLAGGLTPDNVGRAAAQVRPWGVDVASGVESAPGVKDHHKISAFIHSARSAFENAGRALA